MREHLVGREGALWEASPAMGLVLLASVPSGIPQIVELYPRTNACTQFTGS